MRGEVQTCTSARAESTSLLHVLLLHQCWDICWCTEQQQKQCNCEPTFRHNNHSRTFQLKSLPRPPSHFSLNRSSRPMPPPCRCWFFGRARRVERTQLTNLCEQWRRKGEVQVAGPSFSCSVFLYSWNGMYVHLESLQSGNDAQQLNGIKLIVVGECDFFIHLAAYK